MGLRLMERYHAAWFKLVHGSNLVYNTCWEDPRLDRAALELGPRDTIVMITSAGCNALDYALVGPRHIFCVDMNPRQNALLQLKQAAIRELQYEDFFELFGRGRHRDFRGIYARRLRRHLSPRSRHYWDRHQRFFNGRGYRHSFYFEGTSGLVARLMNTYINRKKGLREELDTLLEAKCVEEQREIYDRSLQPFLRGRMLKMLLGRDTTMSLLGVPRQQREQVEKHYGGGIAEFIEDCLESVFAKLPISDNYFWRVYLKGEYTRECCPEYLKPENFAALKDGLVEKVSTHTNTVEGFLRTVKVPITRFVLLDHMDWLSANRRTWLESEWQAIVNRAAPNTRVLFRSGGMKVEYVDPIRVQLNGSKVRVGELLTYHTDLASELHEKDRVHTYGSFYIADMKKG